MMKRIVILVGMVGVLLCSGCASIVSHSTWPVTINSSPSGATVTVKDNRGIEMQKAITPTTLMLRSSAGYFSPASYSFQFEKEGYHPGSASLSAGINGWYIGNIIFGGLIGFLIVDPLTGAMWRLDYVVFGNLSPNPDYKATAPDSQARPETAPQTSEEKKQDDIVTQLKKLKELKDSGILTNEEYESRRKALIEKL